MNEQKVIDLCGDYPTDFSKVDVAINPGYVFQNDTSYSSVQLWDIEGNTVFVNSFWNANIMLWEDGITPK